MVWVKRPFFIFRCIERFPNILFIYYLGLKIESFTISTLKLGRDPTDCYLREENLVIYFTKEVYLFGRIRRLSGDEFVLWKSKTINNTSPEYYWIEGIRGVMWNHLNTRCVISDYNIIITLNKCMCVTKVTFYYSKCYYVKTTLRQNTN